MDRRPRPVGAGAGITSGPATLQLAAVYPELVTETPEGCKWVDYARLVAVLIEAVKELKNENTSLGRRLAAIERRND